jgi:hypothetical protein
VDSIEEMSSKLENWFQFAAITLFGGSHKK